MAEWTAYLNGQFVPADQVSISSEDLGFSLGVTISERLRTFNGRVFRLQQHLARLGNSLQFIGLDPAVDLAQLARLVDELVERNRGGIAAAGDLGVSLFVTPGIPGRGRPTVGIEVYPLPFRQWVAWYDEGQMLTETGIRQVPSSCWPSALKCRSRIHYFQADRIAAERVPGSRALLLDQHDFVTEGSTANILIYRAEQGLISPPRDKILPGVSLAVVAELAARFEIPFTYRDFRLSDITAADEVLMCSTSPCLWTVSRLNGEPVGRGSDGPVFRQLLNAWSELVGLDIVAQARRVAASQ